MTAPRDRKHLLVTDQPKSEAYKPIRRGGSDLPPPPENRLEHARRLLQSLETALKDAERAYSSTQIRVDGAEPGLYLSLEGVEGVKIKPPENRNQGIELVALHPGTKRDPIERATIFVPKSSVCHFKARFLRYSTELTKAGRPKEASFVERIAGIRKAILKDLWTDTADFPPLDEEIWWEVWLRKDEGRELDRFYEFARQVGVVVVKRTLAFRGLTIVLARGTANQLSASLDVLADLAELRKAKVLAGFLVDEELREQTQWGLDVLSRVAMPAWDAPAVCVLDTGVNRGHPLLEPLIAPEEALAVDPSWGTNDDGGGPDCRGHGTEMAGLAAYGDLAEILAANGPVLIRNRVESVKILPPRGINNPEHYGALTAQAISLPEVAMPDRRRVFLLAISSEDGRDNGEPSSWSAAIDALAVGRAIAPGRSGMEFIDSEDERTPRLFVVAAGNVWPDPKHDHLVRSDQSPVHDPAQAWNALTVGAYTERSLIYDKEYQSFIPIAAPGELSPWSSTSVSFDTRWPIKPDVVCEGGNVGFEGTLFDTAIPDLCLLSTYYQPHKRMFVQTYGTSAAATQVARMAAIIAAEYPEYWPETVRGLIVHSARWTSAMEAHFSRKTGKKDIESLVRRYGYGVPNLERALRSAADALTLVSQATIRPYINTRMGTMNIHELPWPREILRALGHANVRLRVTLSYFIEPRPGRRGWRDKYRYASHGLRFKLKGPAESLLEFRKRINELAREEGEEGAGTNRMEGWVLGDDSLNRGSIHSNIWVGTASDLADCGVIGVIPIAGWWKKGLPASERPKEVRYALIVSIETDEVGVDLWTPVAMEMKAKQEIVI